MGRAAGARSGASAPDVNSPNVQEPHPFHVLCETGGKARTPIDQSAAHPRLASGMLLSRRENTRIAQDGVRCADGILGSLYPAFPASRRVATKYLTVAHLRFVLSHLSLRRGRRKNWHGAVFPSPDSQPRDRTNPNHLTRTCGFADPPTRPFRSAHRNLARIGTANPTEVG
jgi:hypothetical protein